MTVQYTHEELVKAMIRNDPVLWSLANRKIKGNPITFESTKVPQKHRPWQVDILRDQHPNKVVMKSRQLGLSEMAVTEFIWFLDNHPHTKGIYTFPRQQQMNDFSVTRIAPIFEEPNMNPKLDKKTNNVALKGLTNGSNLFLRSAWSGALAEGVDADIVGLDEYDRMKDGIENAFSESMKSSAHALLRRWSTPTIPGRGVDFLFSKSDQRYYHHKCDKCGHWQVITLEDNLVQIKPNGYDKILEQVEPGTFDFVCSKCHLTLNRWNVGEWVAAFPDRHETRGYFISQLDAVWISADDIKRDEIKYKIKQLFYNYVIGRPYASEGLIITDQDVYRNATLGEPPGHRDYSRYKKIVAGVDWGYFNWLVILGLTDDNQVELVDLHWVEDNPARPLDSVNYFTAVLKPYDPDFIIADNGFGADRNSYLIQQFPGKVYACDWDTNKSNIPLVDTWSDKTQRVRVDKTVKMKRTLYNIKAGALQTFQRNEKLDMLVKHLKNVRTMMEEEDDAIYERVTRIGDDHLACSLTYAYIALDRILEAHKPNSGFDFDFV